MANLAQTHTYRSLSSTETLIATLSAQTEPTPWPFPVVFKLSGGGVVSQIMQPPKTQKPFFGEASENRIRLAIVTFGKEVTPFQPIIRLNVSPDAHGCTISLNLRPHPKSNAHASVFGLGGLLLICAAIPAILHGLPVGLLAIAFGILCIGFPTWRARLSFESDCRRTLTVLEETLPITKDNQSEENP